MLRLRGVKSVTLVCKIPVAVNELLRWTNFGATPKTRNKDFGGLFWNGNSSLILLRSNFERDYKFKLFSGEMCI